METIEKYKMIDTKCHFYLTADNASIGTNYASKATAEEIAFLRAHKQEIIDFLLKKQNEKEKEKQEKYAPLTQKLPIREFPNTPDEEKFKFLMSQISSQYFTGPEDDGLNHAVQASNAKIRSEARQYCQHEIKIEYFYGFTGDARREIERTIECRKCGLHVVDTVSEPVSENAMWD